MHELLAKYVRLIESVNRFLGNTLCYGLPIMVAIALFEAIFRYAFNSPTPWAVELSAFIMGAMFLLGGGYTLVSKEHVKMDALSSRWSLRTKAIIDIATFPLFAIFLIVIIRGGIPQAIFDLKWGKHSVSMWGPPLAPIKIIIVVGVILLILQGVAVLIKDIATLKGKSIP
jgi:TRAP-type mannitol/chloroaromatic compound transport system permease small subunit